MKPNFMILEPNYLVRAFLKDLVIEIFNFFI